MTILLTKSSLKFYEKNKTHPCIKRYESDGFNPRLLDVLTVKGNFFWLYISFFSGAPQLKINRSWIKEIHS